MAILAISDLILFVTLLVNAGAVLSFKLPASMYVTTPRARPHDAQVQILCAVRAHRCS